ncbi:MAG: leucine-rich repeat protein [Paludibacteraceae bacterium]|nr:leucine-rich repeat protein [Paludibacteraceae bacterium]
MKRLVLSFVSVLLLSVAAMAATVEYAVLINGFLQVSGTYTQNVDNYKVYIATPQLEAGDLIEIISVKDNNTRWMPVLETTTELNNFWQSGDTALLCLQAGCYEFDIKIRYDDASDTKLSIGTGDNCNRPTEGEQIYKYNYGAPNTPTGTEYEYVLSSTLKAYFYDGSGDMIFRGSGDIPDYTSASQAPWSENSGQINHIYMSGAVISSIGKYAFGNCAQLTDVAFSPALTYIGEYAFEQSTGLQAINCPTATPPTIDWSTFNQEFMPQITLTVPDASASQFANDAKWGKMIIPNFSNNGGGGSNPITGNLGDDISWTIYLDKGILEINGYGDMPATGTNTSPWADHATMISLVEVGYGIESLCDYAFDNFISLQEVHLPSTMRSIGDYAFRGCTDLYSIRVLTEEETPTLGNSVFDPSLDLGGVALYVLETMFDQFADADVWMDMNLQIYKEPISGVDDYGSLGEAGIQWFVKNGGTTLQFEGMGDIPAFTNGYVAPWDAYIPTITEVILVGDNITGINADAFASYPKLASVVLPEWFTGIGDGAFANCTLLSTIEIKYEEDVVTLGTDVFSGVDISQIVLYVPDNLVVAYRSDPTWGQMEVHAASDKPIYGSVTQSISWSISGSTLNITGLGAIPDYAEGTDAPWNEYHARIESVFVGDGITYIGNNAFAVCTNVTTATFPATLDSIGVTIFTYDDHSIDIYMFALLPPGISAATFTDLENLITVYPYESVKSLYQNHPLWGNLTIDSQDNPQGSIFGVVGDGVVWSLEDGVLRFEGSGSIPNLQGEDNQPWAEYRDEIFKIYMDDAFITSIGQNAFASCSTFNEIRFSPTLTYIGYYAFRSCTGLMEINACNVPSCIGADVNAFADVTTANISLLVPYDLKGVYQGTQVWADFVYWGCDNGNQGETTIVDSGSFGDGFSWTFDNYNDLRITGSGDMPSYSAASDALWYSHVEEIDAVILSEGIISIGNFAFSGYNSLNVIYLPSSLQLINYKAFANCSNLNAIYCEATTPPTLANEPFDNIVLSQIMLSVPFESVFDYRADATWGQMNVEGKNYGGSGEAINGQIGGVYWELKEGMLRLYGAGEVVFASADEQPWAEYRDQIFKLHVSDEVTLLGAYVMAGCSKMNDVTIQTESLDAIGANAFANCTSLMEITILSEIVITAHNDAFAGVTTSNITLRLMEEIMESYQDGVWADMQKVPLSTMSDYEGNCNDNIRWTFDPGQEKLTISGTGEMPDYSDNNPVPWMQYAGEIISAEVGYGITYVGSQTFAMSLGIQQVDFAATVYSIGDSIFTANNSPITLNIKNFTPAHITEKTFGNVTGMLHVYVYEQAYDAYDSHAIWGQLMLHTNELELESYQLLGIYINGVLINGFMPGLFNYDIVLSAGSEAPVVTYEVGNENQTVTVEQPGSANGGVAYVNVAVDGVNMSTYSLYFSTAGGGSTQGQTVVISLSDTEWTFLMLSGIGKSENMNDIVASDTVIWAMYDGQRRAAGQSGWVVVEDFSATYYKDWGHIVRAKRPGTTLTLTLPENMNNMSETIHLVHTSTGGHPENANWNLIGNPYNALYNIDGLAAVGIESPIAIWNGTGYTTYTPGIDSYKLQPFEAFFIQIPDDGPDDMQLPTDYIEDNNQESDLATVTVPGYFTVGEGKTVKFARGNLQYNPARNVWRFADYAYDIIGSGNENISDSYDGWIDLFGWGTGNHPTLTSTNGEDYSMFVDWGSNAISNAGNVPNTWRTLTSEEWDYLFFYRENASQLYGVGTVNGVKGLIVLPDEWENLPDLNFTSGGSNTVYYQLNVYTEADWGAMQAAGAMFLPTSEMRDGAELVGGDDYGYYWSSTQESVGQAHYMAFYENGVYQNNYSYSQMGHSVRLVRDH